jgi:hypothetical protein
MKSNLGAAPPQIRTGDRWIMEFQGEVIGVPEQTKSNTVL